MPSCTAALRYGTPRSILGALQKGQWLTSLYLKDPYCHIRIHPANRHSLHFCQSGTACQFTVLSWGLSISPSVFTKILKPVLACAKNNHLHGVKLHTWKNHHHWTHLNTYWRNHCSPLGPRHMIMTCMHIGLSALKEQRCNWSHIQNTACIRCESNYEDVMHYVLDCPHYAIPMIKLLEELSGLLQSLGVDIYIYIYIY